MKALIILLIFSTCPLLSWAQMTSQQKVELYTDSIRMYPVYENYIHRAQAYEQMNYFIKAIPDFAAAKLLRPNDSYAYFEQGLCYLYTLNPDSAELDCSKAIELDNGDPRSYSYRGIAYFNLGDPDAAIADFTKAYNLNPAFALYDRGNAYLVKGDYDDANSDLKIIIKRDTTQNAKDQSWAYASYVLSLIFSRDFEKASAEWKLYKRNKIHSYLDDGGLVYLNTFIEIGTSDLKSNNFRAALAELESMTRRGYRPPSNAFLNNQIKGYYAEILATRAWVYEKLDSADRALEYYKKAAVINVHNNAFSEKINSLNQVIAQKIANDKTAPIITLLTPVSSGDNITAEVDASGNMLVSGRVYDPAGIGEIKVNGVSPQNFDDAGSFQVIVNQNAPDLAIAAKDKKGNMTTKTYHVANRKLITGSDKPDIQPADEGRYYAIFIACANYTLPGLDQLPTTIPEANALRKMLEEKYNFDPRDVDTIYNKDRTTILNVLSARVEKLGPNDNLVIFYGGHGTYRADLDAAFWIPLNASSQTEYITNGDITLLINGTRAKHILVIADACFSGALRSGIATPAKYEYKLPSRQLLTSGSIEKVKGKSVFVEKLIASLEVNQDPYINAVELYNSIYDPVHLATGNEPLLRDMQQVMNSGVGQFFFKKK